MKYDLHQVLIGEMGRKWKVTDRFKDVDTGNDVYTIMDESNGETVLGTESQIRDFIHSRGSDYSKIKHFEGDKAEFL